MPNLANAKKALRQSKTRQDRNNAQKKMLKETLKEATVALEKGDATAKDAVAKAMRALDKATKNSLIHANKAARHKAQLQKRLNTSK